MSVDLLTPRRLTPSDAPAAAEVLARAFVGDPLWRWLLPEQAKRAALVQQCFRAAAPVFIASALAFGVGAPLEGVAVWSAPDQARPRIETLLSPNLLALVFSPLLTVIPRAAPIFGRFETMQRRYAPEPHYALNTIGVSPNAQGRGRAAALLRPVLAQADTRGLTVYTETMTPENVSFYEHYGFVVREEYRVPDTALSIWALQRPRLADAAPLPPPRSTARR